MKLPKRVLIGTQVWQIVERDRASDGMLAEPNFGYTLSQDNLIVIDNGLTPSRKKQTLLHEILHAIRYTFDNSVTPTKKDDLGIWEHYFIGLYEEGLLLTIRDNPDLLDYLLETE